MNKVLDYNGFEIMESGRYDGYTQKYPYALRYRGRIIDYGETIETWKRVVDKMPDWLQRKTAEIDRWKKTAAGKLEDSK